ncbi:MAG: hypothetical protein IT328_23995 [Caldilineaceae bacterium]|nr:hypothetical protein [Caldilineaceae bacterium]
MSIRAIDTQYKGYRFRSRLEARWAVFFDALGIKWEYEKEGHDLGDAGWYLPDFWLPAPGYWFEVKPQDRPTESELNKAIYLASLSGQHVIIACGTPGMKALDGSAEEDELIGNLRWVWPRKDVGDDDHLVDMQWVHNPRDGYRVGSFGGTTIEEWHLRSGSELDSDPYHPTILRAYSVAQSARFEHGETPSRK